jgi:DNA-binding transcriptional LysR family regulator
MDLAQLRTLLHIAELGSVSRAAERLGIAQPALSRQIRLMEAELNAPLFTRHGRGMALTELGERLIAPASAIFARVEEMRQLAREDPRDYQGRVRIGVTPTVAEVATVPLVRSIRGAHTRLSLCFTSGFSGHLIEWLKRDELDCCVAYETHPSPLIRTRSVLEETLVFATAEGGRRRSQTIAFADLSKESLVLPSRLHGLRTILDQCADRAGIVLSPSLEVDSLTAMLDLVREGFGSTILPLAPIHARVIAGELQAIPLIDPVPSRRVVIAYPADRPVPPTARLVGEAFANVARNLVNRGIWSGRMIGDQGEATNRT